MEASKTAKAQELARAERLKTLKDLAVLSFDNESAQEESDVDLLEL